MKLEDALKPLAPVRGVTSIVDALLSGNLDPVAGKARVGETLIEAKQKLEAAQTSQSNCGSDAAWWGWQGDISYWRTIVNILEAAQITGPDNLPDIQFVPKGGVVMDQMAGQERYGRAMLEAARNSVTPEQQQQLNRRAIDMANNDGW